MDHEARRVIEALRSGIPSRTIGTYFAGARAELLTEISEWLDAKTGGGRILTGSYGEGKTHLLSTVFSMAQKKNMAVSTVSISKETPLNNLYVLFHKIALNTYLPDREQPGFEHLIGQLSSESMAELQLYAAKNLQTDKLYYLLKAYCNTDNPETRFSLMADIQGDFIGNPQLKKLYKDIFSEKITFSANFAKSRHTWDYFMFLNRLFSISGLQGWVLLFDETELVGKFGRKTRFNAYTNMAKFLNNESGTPFSLLMMTSNYMKEVIEAKDEHGHLEENEEFDRELIESVLNRIESANELPPLDKIEFEKVILQIIDFHARAFDWDPQVDKDNLCEMAWSRGYYLRTKIRAAIEYLDQLLQYGDAGDITAGELEQETYQETYQEEIPLPDEL